MIPIPKRNTRTNTNTSTDLFEEYLIENRHRNRIADQYKLSKINKAVATFDPLGTTEPNKDNVTLDLLAEESGSNNSFVISGTKSPNVDNAGRERTSESSTDQGLILVQKMGKKLTCKHCGHSWIFSGKLTRYYASCPRCHSSIRIKPLPRKTKTIGAKP